MKNIPGKFLIVKSLFIMLKNVVFLFSFCIANVFISQAQNVKLSGDQILIDKVKKFDIVHPLNKKGKIDRDKIYVKDLQGNTVLEVRDSFYYYTKLYYEREVRIITPAYYFLVPSLNRSGFALPVEVSSLKHSVFSSLKDIKFFTTCLFTNELFDLMMADLRGSELENLVETGQEADKRRIINADASAKKFGQLKIRTNMKKTNMIVVAENPVLGMVIEDLHTAGTLKVKTNTNYSKVWNVLNNNDVIVATFAHIKKDNVVNVRTLLDDKLTSFDVNFGVTDYELLKEAARFLVIEGYL